MISKGTINKYNDREEKLNVITHGFGLILSIIGLVLLVIYSSLYGNIWHIISFTIYGFSLILLYTASTIFHNAKDPILKIKLNVFDHASIYVLIAGTYTPYTLVGVHGKLGWIMFGVTWGLALIGIFLKLFFTGKYKILSTIMYVAMGWLIIVFISPLKENVGPEAINWLLAGGIAYTIGAILYSINKLNYNHAIFHVFVLIGSFCHFISIFFYLL